MSFQNTPVHNEMHILIGKISTGIFGGAERATIDMAIALASAGLTVTIATNDKNIIRESQIRDIGVKKIPLNGLSGSTMSKLTYPFLWLVCGMLSLNRKYDCIITNSRIDFIGFTLFKFLHSKPVLHQDHGDIIHLLKLNRQSMLATLNQHMLVSALERADKIFFLNKQHRTKCLEIFRNLNARVSARNTSVLRTDILFDEYPAVSSKHINRTKEATVITFIGRLDETKGAHLLPRVIKHFSSRSDVIFWIVGDGPFSGQLELPRVTLFGYKKNVSRYIIESDIVIQPSLEEGWGRTVEEAMLFGKPVVGSDIGGISEQISHGKDGLLFTVGDIEDFCTKLSELIDNPKLRLRLGKRAKEKVLRRGDYHSIVNSKLIPEIKSAISR